MRENEELMRRAITQPGEIPDEDELVAAAQVLADKDKEEEDEGERFERLLREGFMGLCVKQCSKSKLRVGYLLKKTLSSTTAHDSEYLGQCEIPDLPEVLEPELDRILSTPPSPVLEDGLIQEDSEPGSYSEEDARQLKMAHIHLESTIPYMQEEVQPSVNLAPNEIPPQSQLPDDDTDEIMSDIIVESLAVDRDHDHDLISEDSSSLASRFSDMSEDVWSFPESPIDGVQASMRDQQSSAASLLLGSPPRSLTTISTPVTASFSNEWRLSDGTGHERSSISHHETPIRPYDGDDGNIRDYDEEEVYDF